MAEQTQDIQQEIREKILDFENQIARDPQSDAYFPLSELYMQLNESKKACEICVYGLKYHPSYYPGYLILGATLMQLGKFDRAEKAYATAFKMNPSESEALFHLCKVYEKMENFKKLQEVMHQLEIIAPYDNRLQEIRHTVNELRQIRRDKITKENIQNRPVEQNSPQNQSQNTPAQKIPPTQLESTPPKNETNEMQELKTAPPKIANQKINHTPKKITREISTPKGFNFDNFIEELFKIDGINGIVFMNQMGQVSRSMDFDVDVAKSLAKILRSYSKAFKISFGILRYGDWQECTIDLDEGFIFLLNIGTYKLAFHCSHTLKLGNFRARLHSTIKKHGIITS